eukprot:TRINITY_DN3243_c0_g1_i2.p3 TRINITY_DN3243_c0_g1~~TRINITY_DN3243_c0_g1_i2.p3  ORF type:complete len:200 (-),score=20.76 TRINITY_DN3243_c0_g1_i2:1557-2156(-)
MGTTRPESPWLAKKITPTFKHIKKCEVPQAEWAKRSASSVSRSLVLVVRINLCSCRSFVVIVCWSASTSADYTDLSEGRMENKSPERKERETGGASSCAHSRFEQSEPPQCTAAAEAEQTNDDEVALFLKVRRSILILFLGTAIAALFSIFQPVVLGHARMLRDEAKNLNDQVEAKNLNDQVEQSEHLRQSGPGRSASS